MRLNWKSPWLAMLAFAALPGTGCSGINASGSVSPLMFFLPKAGPPAATPQMPVAVTTPSTQLAQAR